VTVPVRTPRGEADWDEMRWWLAHGGVLVSKDEDGWRVHVETRCGHLRPDNACGVYAHRPRACAEYDAATCEYTGPLEYDVLLRSEDDLADYLERRRLRRGASVARAIRAAARAPELVALRGLEPA
jgi:Fe-S-cluster containining protein